MDFDRENTYFSMKYVDISLLSSERTSYHYTVSAGLIFWKAFFFVSKPLQKTHFFNHNLSLASKLTMTKAPAFFSLKFVH